MKLLGHHNANMTLLYVEVTQQDLQREYHAARLQPRHQVPVPAAFRPDTLPTASADASAVQTALASALRLLDLHRQLLLPSLPSKDFLLLSRRLARILSLFQKLTRGPASEK
jgi:hypothetical protein